MRSCAPALEQQLTDVEALAVSGAVRRGERSAWPGQETSERWPERLLGDLIVGAPPAAGWQHMGCLRATARLGLALPGGRGALPAILPRSTWSTAPRAWPT